MTWKSQDYRVLRPRTRLSLFGLPSLRSTFASVSSVAVLRWLSLPPISTSCSPVSPSQCDRKGLGTTATGKTQVALRTIPCPKSIFLIVFQYHVTAETMALKIGTRDCRSANPGSATRTGGALDEPWGSAETMRFQT